LAGDQFTILDLDSLEYECRGFCLYFLGLSFLNSGEYGLYHLLSFCLNYAYQTLSLIAVSQNLDDNMYLCVVNDLSQPHIALANNPRRTKQWLC
jgi:hypothetical protein